LPSQQQSCVMCPVFYACRVVTLKKTVVPPRMEEASTTLMDPSCLLPLLPLLTSPLSTLPPLLHPILPLNTIRVSSCAVGVVIAVLTCQNQQSTSARSDEVFLFFNPLSILKFTYLHCRMLVLPVVALH